MNRNDINSNNNNNQIKNTGAIFADFFHTDSKQDFLGKGIKDVNKIDKNLEALWPFTYDVVNIEERIK